MRVSKVGLWSHVRMTSATLIVGIEDAILPPVRVSVQVIVYVFGNVKSHRSL